MGRRGAIWQRSDRPGWYATIGGKQIRLGLDEAEARREFHRLMAIDAPLTKRVSTEVLIDRYLGERKAELATETYSSKLQSLQSFVDHFGKVKAGDLRPHHITTWLTDHPEWGQGTRYLRTSIVKTWSRWAKAEGYIDADHLRDKSLPGPPTRAPAKVGDLERLIKKAYPELRDFLIVLGDTACRPGEVRSLEAARIDFKASTAVVHGKAGPRVVGLTMRALGALKRLSMTWPVGPVMRNEFGRPWSKSTLRKRINAACEAAGVIYYVPYHARHDAARRLVRAGVSDLLIQEQYGHIDLTMLKKHYFHPETEQLAEAVESAVSRETKPARARAPARRGSQRPRRGLKSG